MENNIEVHDMLVFEDNQGHTFQDCVFAIDDNFKLDISYVCTGNIYKPRNNRLFKYVITDECEEYRGPEIRASLKEIWRKVDDDTYKKVWSKDNEY